MTRLLNEVKGDAQFIKGHTLQPKWFKAVKILILLGFLAGYTLLLGWLKYYDGVIYATGILGSAERNSLIKRLAASLRPGFLYSASASIT